MIRRHDLSIVAAAYSALSLALTWPLVLGLGRDVPADLGDSLLNMWILAWDAEHLPRLATGMLSWQGFWNANIFHPATLSLAFSEHLVGQALQILPVYWATGNIILCYNLLFLSTFVLSGLGTYLLVRDLTGDRRAAFIAGLVYGFLPYRIASMPHLQVLSSQWMPLALWGLDRFAMTGSRRGLAGGTAALVMQNWSCGYYQLYFAPVFVPLFVAHRLWTSGRWARLDAWLSLAASAVVTLALSLPFLLPYAEARTLYGFVRPFGEVTSYSANVWSYATASEGVRLWGHVLRAWPRGEGETFLGFVPVALAIVALWSAAREDGTGRPYLFSRWLARIAATLVALQAVALALTIAVGGFETHLFGITVAARTPLRMFVQTLAAVAVWLVVSAPARRSAWALARSVPLICAVSVAVAAWLSLGPLPMTGLKPLAGTGLYGLLYSYVPGFNGVRVPARYAMVAGLYLSVLAGYGVAAMGRYTKHTAVMVAVSLLVLAEGVAVPIDLNQTWVQTEAMPPARVYPAAGAPPVYARLATLDPGTVVTELPFGDAGWELRYVYYSTVHWKPITNGYSGSFPPAYMRRAARLKRPMLDPAASWQALVDSGTTHVVLHPDAFRDPADAAAIRQWLLASGASIVETFDDGDMLFVLRPVMRM